MAIACYLLVITNLYLYSALCRETCSTFSCKWSVDSYELDLTPFQLMGLNLTGHDKNNNDYYYTPCNNLIPHDARWRYMAVQVHDEDERNFLAQYDQTIDPVIRFDENSELIWSFQYNENFTVEYICDYDSTTIPFMEITQILEIYPDSFLMTVSSPYVCNNATVSDEINRNQCVWYDDDTSNALDLRFLYGEQIRSGTSNYYLYVCQNSLYVSSSNGACTSYGCCAMYGSYGTGFWDPSVQPTFNPNINEWTFIYKGYPYGPPSNMFTLRWICDPKIYLSVLRSTKFAIDIATVYACPEEMRCIFVDNDNENNVLDLTHLYGDMIRAVNDDKTYSFEYTVCNNNIVCNDSVSAMAMRWDIYETQCDPYLAVWDGFNGYDLSYDDSLKQWKFTYYNGALCGENGMNTEFNIYWKCNQTVADWDVTNVETINQCQYAMYIDSSYVC